MVTPTNRRQKSWDVLDQAALSHAQARQEKATQPVRSPYYFSSLLGYLIRSLRSRLVVIGVSTLGKK